MESKRKLKKRVNTDSKNVGHFKILLKKKVQEFNFLDISVNVKNTHFTKNGIAVYSYTGRLITVIPYQNIRRIVIPRLWYRDSLGKKKESIFAKLILY